MKSIRNVVQDQRLDEEAATILLTQSAGPAFREITGFNFRGCWTLFLKEIWRFMKIWEQTVLSPLVMTILFYAVFALAMNEEGRTIGNIPFLQFLIPGLVMMSMAQASFMNPAVALVISKLQKNIVDVLMAPLSPLELTLAYAFAGLFRGLLVGAVSIGVMMLLMPISFMHVGFILYYAGMGCLMLSLIGLLTGICGEDFDNLGAVQNFIITPATFLSGTFFSVHALPASWSWTCFYNPFFYMIDGFRYGFTGYNESNIWSGMGLLFIICLVLMTLCYWLFARSEHLRT